MLTGRDRGDATVYGHDQAPAAILLERFGPKLDELGLSVDAQIEVICAMLAEAWAPLPGGACSRAFDRLARQRRLFVSLVAHQHEDHVLPLGAAISP